MLLAVLGVGNPNVEGNFRDDYLVAVEAGEDYDGQEYATVGPFMGNLMVTLRMSMGDFGFDHAKLLEKKLKS